MSADPDGDSVMASSPESDHMPSDSSQAGSRTPTKAPAADPRSDLFELSPPGSQTQQVSESISATESAKTVPVTEPATQAQQPGASWMNKRAEEEYQRASEFIIDKDFSLAEFGDPFDERDMKKELF